MESLQPGDPAAVGPYRLLARLGAGGMGVVYLARSPGARLAALKLIRKEFAADPGFRERFRREIAAAGRVSGIYTAPVLDADATAPQPWYAAGYVPAPTLYEGVEVIGSASLPPNSRGAHMWKRPASSIASTSDWGSWRSRSISSRAART